MRTSTIIGVGRDPASGMWLIAREEDDENGKNKQHVIGIYGDAMHWRAAEYGLEAADSRTLLDVVLHEAFLSDEHYLPGTGPHQTSEAEAAEAHRRRITFAKKMITLTDPADHLQVIHDHHAAHPLDPLDLAKMRIKVWERRRANGVPDREST